MTHCCRNIVYYVILLTVCVFINKIRACRKSKLKDVIAFPETSLDSEKRQSLYIPAKCPENMLFYPGYQKDDWICDCRPGYLFHVASDKCWEAFRMGPCPKRMYLVMPPNSQIPKCVENPCIIDSYVPYGGKCEKLSSGCDREESVKVLGVNIFTLHVDCAKLNLDFRFSDELYFKGNVTCLPGGMRSAKYSQC